MLRTDYQFLRTNTCQIKDTTLFTWGATATPYCWKHEPEADNRENEKDLT